MAFPSVFTTAGFSLTTAGTSASFGYSLNPTAGQLVVAGIRFCGAPGTITFTGYTALTSLDTSDASDDSTILYYRWTDGAEGSTDPISWVNSVKVCCAGYVFNGAADPASQAPETSAVAVGTTAANSANSTAATPTGGAKDYLWMVFMALDGELNAPTAVPTNYSGLGSSNSGTAGAAATNASCGIGWRQLNAASEDPGAWTHAAATTGWTAWTVAIHPAAAAATLVLEQGFVNFSDPGVL
jgi:hypothetical protein